MTKITPEQIDELLPQTQCGLCGYAGCMPYAEAMLYEQAEINLCLPGGVNTLLALGQLLEQDPIPYVEKMQEQAKPPAVAIIREAECIGCTKCIQACPVDAIIGSAKQMHTIITSECTGCELCVAPCPVDCIDILSLAEDESLVLQKEARHLRARYHAKQQRLAKEKQIKNAARSAASLQEKKHYLEEVALRVKAKKNNPG